MESPNESSVKGTLSIDTSTIDEVRALNVTLRNRLGSYDEVIKAARNYVRSNGVDPAELLKILTRV